MWGEGEEDFPAHSWPSANHKPRVGFLMGPLRATAQRSRCLYPRVPCGEWNFLAGDRHAPNHLADPLRGTSRHHYLGGGLDERPTFKLIPLKGGRSPAPSTAPSTAAFKKHSAAHHSISITAWGWRRSVLRYHSMPRANAHRGKCTQQWGSLIVRGPLNAAPCVNAPTRLRH